MMSQTRNPNNPSQASDLELLERERSDQPGGPGSLGADSLAERLFAKLPPEVRESLSEAQTSALVRAANDCGRREHGIDIRFSLPLLSKRFYVALLSGEERRSAARREIEHAKHPIARLSNLLFLAFLTSVFTVIGGLIWTVIFTWYLSG